MCDTIDVTPAGSGDERVDWVLRRLVTAENRDVAPVSYEN